MEITSKYGSESYLDQSYHNFNIQTNEAMNLSQVALTPKIKVFYSSKAFHYRDTIVIGTHNWGFTKNWRKTFDRVGVRYSPLLVSHLELVEGKHKGGKKCQRKLEVKQK